MRFSSAKYAEGVLLVGEEKFHDGDESFDWQQRSPQAEFGWPQPSAGTLT
jgi:hypothetical protein